MKEFFFYILTSLCLISIASCSKKESDETGSSSDKLSTNKPESNTIPDTSKLSKAVFAGGCFWCEEIIFESVKGVGEVVSGYAGGHTKNPTYEESNTGKTGHAEAILVYYDSSVVDFQNLLRVYFASIDPTQVNGQGPDKGSQYRSIIFYDNENEKQLAEKFIEDLSNSGKYDDPIAVEVMQSGIFYPAEKYHQDYIKYNPDNPYVVNESIPRLERTKKQIPDLIKR